MPNGSRVCDMHHLCETGHSVFLKQPNTVGKQLQIYGFFYTAPKHKARTDDDRNQTKSNPNYKNQMTFRVHMGSVSSPASTY